MGFVDKFTNAAINRTVYAAVHLPDVAMSAFDQDLKLSERFKTLCVDVPVHSARILRGRDPEYPKVNIYGETKEQARQPGSDTEAQRLFPGW